MTTEHLTSASSVAAQLRDRAERSRRDATLLAARIERLSLIRLLVALAVVIAAAGAIGEPRYRVVFILALVLALAGFITLVVQTRRLRRLRNRALGRATVSEQGASRADRMWSQIDPQRWQWPRDDGEHERVDLDVTGHESLVQLLPTISAAVGAPRMREWFGIIEDEATIRARQASVRELAGMLDLRESFELAARRLQLSETRVAAFIEWGRMPRQPEPAWLAVAARALPALAITTIFACAVVPAIAPLALLLVCATATLAYAVRGRTRGAVVAADAGANIANAYAELAGLVCDASFESPLLCELREKLDPDSGQRADAALQQLRRLSDWAEVRASPMMHAALQALFAWDYQIARAVENWRTDFGSSLAAWFASFAELECLAALAGLAYANPAWTFPDLARAQPVRVRARGLGHPLLAENTRVTNDVEIGPPGTVLLISGSNMSGKSTLLRAIGLNTLLARVGGPVCAEAMWCAPLRLLTSLRVQDSLAEGISYFMAEALRLRDIVFAAESSGDAGATPVLYLVDEILRGTNSEERAVASRFIVARLLKTPAIGAITTHDLGVFDVPEIAQHARHAHFAEQFTGEGEARRLTFDYHLRPGPATSRNALQLLSMIGLDHQCEGQ